MYLDEALAQCRLFPHKAARYTEQVCAWRSMLVCVLAQGCAPGGIVALKENKNSHATHIEAWERTPDLMPRAIGRGRAQRCLYAYMRACGRVNCISVLTLPAPVQILDEAWGDAARKGLKREDLVISECPLHASCASLVHLML